MVKIIQLNIISINTKLYITFVKWLSKENETMVFSQGALRITVGLLGFLLPVTLVLYTMVYGNCEPDVLASISDYFHAKGRSLFVGILSAVSLTFFVFKGYNVIDEVFGKIACISCIGIIAFPTKICQPTLCHITSSTDALKSTLHFTSAGIFFGCLVVFSLFLFPLSYKGIEQQHRTKRMKWRNFIYKFSGIIIIVAMFLIFTFSKLVSKEIHDDYIQYNPVFWLETVMLFAFAISWLTKSQHVWPDELKKDPC